MHERASEKRAAKTMAEFRTLYIEFAPVSMKRWRVSGTIASSCRWIRFVAKMSRPSSSCEAYS